MGQDVLRNTFLNALTEHNDRVVYSRHLILRVTFKLKPVFILPYDVTFAVYRSIFGYMMFRKT